MKNKKIISALLCLCLLMSLCACGKSEEAVADAGVAVQTQKVEKSDIFTENKVSGQVISSAESSVYFNGSAKCTSVSVKTGSTIKKGAVVAKFDPKTYTEVSGDAYSSTSDQLLVLNMQVDMAKDAYDAARALKAVGAASDVEIQSAEIQYLGAKMQRDQLLASLELALANSGSSANSVNENAEYIDTEKGIVYAPQDGTVISVSAQAGEYLNESFPIIVISGEEKLKISTYVSEAVVTKLSVGASALVNVTSAGASFNGSIASIDQSANSQTRLYTVTVSVPEDQTGLLNGMFADVTFYSDASYGSVTVPSEAVLNSNGTEYVFIIENGTAKYVDVETGIVSNGYTEIVSGLKGGEELVTVGQSYLKDGAVVRVITE